MKKDKEIIVDVLTGFDKKEGEGYSYGFKYSGKNRKAERLDILNPNKTRNKQGKRGDQNIYTDYTNCISSNGAGCVQKNNDDRAYGAAEQIFHKFAHEGYYINYEGKKLWRKDGKTFEGDSLLERIKNSNKFFIAPNTKHLVNYFGSHGSKEREVVYKSGKSAEDYTLLSHFYRIPTESFQNLKSFYFKSSACCGGFYDRKTNVFDEIQHKLKEIQKPNKPKCFVRLLKKQYEGFTFSEYDKDEKSETKHFKELPIEDKNHLDIDDIYDNPDNYFDYYYVEEDKIYKVSHEFVHNRRQLTENEPKLFDEALQKEMKKGSQYGIVDKKKEFYEFYKKQEEIQNEEQKALDLKEKKNTYTRDYFYNFMKQPSNISINNVSDKQNLNKI